MSHKKVRGGIIILFIGDVVGKIGRKCLTKVLPELREEYRPDLVIANAENIAHGKGITRDTLNELFSAGVNVATGGNHSFKKDEVVTLLGDPSVPLLRPANFPDTVPGSGARVVEVGTRKILVLNINGRVFMHEGVDDPFASLDSILRQHDQEQYAATIVDFHGEATSEKVAFGWYADGRVSAVVGTHTHVPTADEWILPNGTAYVTDAGMCGGRDTVIGITKDHALRGFRSPLPGKFEPPDEGVARFNSVLIEVDPKTRKALNIERIDRELEV